MEEANDTERKSAVLNRLLRAQLTAVNQQSVHLIALRSWGARELEARIQEVDRSDFPATLAVIDHMVRSGTPICIESEPFTPGANERAILLAEQAIEARLAAAVAPLEAVEGPVGQLAASVAAPRAGYSRWIAQRLIRAKSGATAEVPLAADLAGQFACLTVMGEQALVHAHIHWHRGSQCDADAAWGMSGAAMIQTGAIIRLLAGEGTVPIFGKVPALDIQEEPADAIAADKRLAECCWRASIEAADHCEVAAARQLALGIASSAAAWARREPGESLLPDAGSTRTFASFAHTRRKFLAESHVASKA